MEPQYSEFANDEDWRELLEGFVATIPTRIASIRQATLASDSDRVKTLVHQLRGSCGSYGFHHMTPIATQLELELISNPAINSQLDQIEQFIHSLESLACTPTTPPVCYDAPPP